MANATAVKLTAKELEAIKVTGFEMPTIDAIKQAIISGKTSFQHVQQFGGCGRAYTCVGVDYKRYGDVDSKVRTKLSNAIAKQVKQACSEINILWCDKAYGVGSNAIYIGYDNGTSKEWSQATQVAKNLQTIGIGAYEDGQGD